MGFQIKIFPILRVFWSISFGKVLCSSAKVLHASEKLIKCFFLRRLYSINIDCFVRDSSRLHLTFVAFCLLSDIHFVCQSALLTGSSHILRHQYGISVAESLSQTFLRAREVTAFS